MIKTSDVVRRTSKPLRPVDFTLLVKYEFETKSREIHNYVNQVKAYVDEVERRDRDDRANRRQPERTENWYYDIYKIYITGPTLLLSLAGRRVEEVLTSGAFGIKIRPTETETGSLTKDQVSLIGYADFTRTPPFRLSPSVRVVPPPNMQIEIDRASGDIVERVQLNPSIAKELYSV